VTWEIYGGSIDLFVHIDNCVVKWEDEGLSSQFWDHWFCNSLGPILKAWYMHEETRRQTRNWIFL